MVEVTHALAEPELSAYLDGELDSEQARALRAHIEGCELCQELLDELRSTREAVATMASARAPKGLLRGVQRTIALRSHGRFFCQRSSFQGIPYEAVAVTMMLVLSAFMVQALGQQATRFRHLDGDLPHGPAGIGPEGSWGSPEGVLYRLEVLRGASPARARRVTGELATRLDLDPPRVEGDVLIYQVPRDLVAEFLETVSSQLPLRVDRLPLENPKTARLDQVSVELVVPSP